MPLDPEPPDLSNSPLDEVVVAGTAAALAAEKSGHHGPIHTHCENCGAKLEGPFCHRCGQHDFEFHRSFGHVFLDALENFFHFDSKLFHNVVTLLFSPGRLTADFNAGKRAAQMPPFRLYLFVSFLFFLISFLGSHPSSDLNLDDTPVPKQREAVRQALAESLKQVAKNVPNPADRVRAERAIRRLQEANDDPTGKPADLLKVDQAIADEIKKEEAAQKPAAEAAAPAGTAPDAKPAKKILRTNNPGGLNFSVDEKNNTALERFLSEKGKYAYYHQREFVEDFIHALPKMLLLCLPFFALYTRVLFRKSGQVYLQHLVLALHFHTFIYLWVLFRSGWGDLAALASPGLRKFVIFAATLWMLVYPVLMFRRLFANSWLKTAVKTGLLAGAYAFTLGLGFLGTAVVLFLLL